MCFNKKQLKTNVWVTLDNALVHTSEERLKYLKSLNAISHFLPPHSPELAPVELFFRLIKRKMLKQYSTKIINFDRQSGRRILFEVLND